MKVRSWEIRQHINSILGPEAEVFAMPGSCVRVWIVRPGFSIYQREEEIAVGIDGLLGNYFLPDLDRINRASIDLADRIAGVHIGNDDINYGDPFAIEKLFS